MQADDAFGAKTGIDGDHRGELPGSNTAAVSSGSESAIWATTNALAHARLPRTPVAPRLPSRAAAVRSERHACAAGNARRACRRSVRTAIATSNTTPLTAMFSRRGSVRRRQRDEPRTANAAGPRPTRRRPPAAERFRPSTAAPPAARGAKRQTHRQLAAAARPRAPRAVPPDSTPPRATGSDGGEHHVEPGPHIGDEIRLQPDHLDADVLIHGMPRRAGRRSRSSRSAPRPC